MAAYAIGVIPFSTPHVLSWAHAYNKVPSRPELARTRHTSTWHSFDTLSRTYGPSATLSTTLLPQLDPLSCQASKAPSIMHHALTITMRARPQGRPSRVSFAILPSAPRLTGPTSSSVPDVLFSPLVPSTHPYASICKSGHEQDRDRPNISRRCRRFSRGWYGNGWNSDPAFSNSAHRSVTCTQRLEFRGWFVVADSGYRRISRLF